MFVQGKNAYCAGNEHFSAGDKHFSDGDKRVDRFPLFVHLVVNFWFYLLLSGTLIYIIHNMCNLFPQKEFY